MPCSLAILPISAIGIDDANFVVGVHDGDQNGFRADGGFQLIRVDPAVFLHRQIGDFVAVFFEALAGVEDSLVLDGLGDDVIALFAVHFRDALDHQVVGFGGAAGENDLFRRGVDQRSDLLARGFDGFFAGPAEAVIAAGGVAKLLGEIGQHRFHDARIDGRGRVIVHVNRQLDRHFLRLLTRTHVRTRTHGARQGDKRGLIGSPRSSAQSLQCSKLPKCFRSPCEAARERNSAPWFRNSRGS